MLAEILFCRATRVLPGELCWEAAGTLVSSLELLLHLASWMAMEEQEGFLWF